MRGNSTTRRPASGICRDREKHYGGTGYHRLSSANSINLGRLAPQVAYYFKSYMDLVRRGEIAMGEEVNFVVPTGNFGDILAGDFARRMGLPVAKLICASNANNVLTAFIRTGLYDRRRAFHKTASPSMDILCFQQPRALPLSGERPRRGHSSPA
ncbi:MAG: hypothetical protein ACLUE1_04370 [Adlercreutzia equolifaciens]